MNRVVLFLTNPLTLAAFGLTALVLLIWFVGPLLGVASSFPLASTTIRVLVSTLLLLMFALRMVWNYLHAKRENAQFLERLSAEEKAAADAADEVSRRSREEVADVAARFKAAIAEMKTARTEGATGIPAWKHYLGLVGRRFVYELPWYVFVGAPGSGKTTALLNAGLRFPLAAKLGTEPIQGVGGTRACDWWFTDDAVLIDTAGRYATQDSEAAVDASAWKAFLANLRKYRGRQPLDGILLTVSVPDLLGVPKAERERLAARLRTRLAELSGELGMRVPVYVLVTKTDLLAGFNEFFGALTREEREQVWGLTLPFGGGEDSQKVEGAPLLARLGSEFTALAERLEGKVQARLIQDLDISARAQVFGFPQQFGALTPVLAEFVNEICATPKLGSAPLLRGVYFTSGTQEGNPIDRVMGALARTFRVQARAALRPPGSGRAYFLTRLLRDVIFQEQGTLVLDPRRARRQRLWRYGGLAVSGALALFLLCGFTVSTIRNGLYVSEVSGQLPAVADGLKQMPRDLASPEALVKAAALLGGLQHAAVTSVIDPEQPPFSAGFGLFQGDKLAGAAGLAYQKALQQVLLPAIDQSLEQHLARIDDKALDTAYDTLRVYIMVHDPAHYDAAAIRAWVLSDWAQRLPQAVPEEDRSRLAGHLDALLTHGTVHSPRPANDALIQQARSALARDTLAGRIYGRIKRTPTDIALPEFTVVDAGGPSAALTFERASQQPLTRGIGGLFSVAGYLKVFRPAVPKVARQLTAEEPWVLGTAGKPQDLTRVASDVRQLYLDEYIKVWDGFLADVRVARPASLQRTVELTRVLAQPDSPLTRLMRAVARETALLAATQASGGDAGKAVNTAGDLSMQSRTFGMEANKVGRKLDELQRSANDLGKLANTASSAGTLAGGIPNDGAERIVDEHFAAVRQLTEGKPSGLDTLSGLMTELNSSLVAADAAVKAGGAPPNNAELQSKLKAATGGMPPVVQKMMDTVSGSGASQTQGAAIENWKKAWQSSVGELCGKAVAGRYPFVRSATRDVARDDFVQLFAPGGLIDDFFAKNLASSVDTTAHPWRFRTAPGAAPQGGSLAVFQSAAAIRDAFFRTGGGKGVGFRLDFKLVELADGVKDVTLDLDGQPLKFTQTNGLPISAAWPGPNGGAGLKLQAGSGAGLQIEGPWAPLHLIDKADIEAGAQAERFKARLSIDGKKLAFEITAGSVLNPLRLKELSTFSCTAL